jgi:hypothetical protein
LDPASPDAGHLEEELRLFVERAERSERNDHV